MQKDYSNYNEYDHISVSINKAVKKETVQGYKALGWELYKSYPDKNFSNVEHYEFYRPHKIENKDRLQLLQVYMESAINNLSRRQKSRHLTSLNMGVLLGLICTIFVAGGIVLLNFSDGLFVTVCGYIISSLGIIGGILSFIYLKFLVKKERESYNRQIKFGVNRIRQIHEEAAILTGVKDE